MQPIQPRASVTAFVLLAFKWRISKFGVGVGNLGDCFLQAVCLREAWWQALGWAVGSIIPFVHCIAQAQQAAGVNEFTPRS